MGSISSSTLAEASKNRTSCGWASAASRAVSSTPLRRSSGICSSRRDPRRTWRRCGSGRPKGFAAGLVGAFIAAFVLGLLIQYARDANVAGLPKGIAGGLIVGFLVWFGFLLTTGVSGAIFEGRSGKLVGINQGFWILSYLLMGAILGYWV